jgi:hypothetical protein
MLRRKRQCKEIKNLSLERRANVAIHPIPPKLEAAGRIGKTA